MPDLPVLLDEIRLRPDDGARWPALAVWLNDHDRHDEATAVRVLWPTLRAHVLEGGVSVDATLADLTEHRHVMGQVARRIEDREPA